MALNVDQQVQLAGLQTEARNPRTKSIDRFSTIEICAAINKEDSTVSLAVRNCIPVIARVIEAVAQCIRNEGRVFFIGAGTSGRLGVLDASEIPPTYSLEPDRFIALIAGGDRALRRAMEGAEDSRSAAETELLGYELDPDRDVVIGIASSGRTPYVLGGLSFAKRLGCTTAGIVCVSPSEMELEGNTDYLIAAVTGPEVVTGSTRMKAGTATKLVLNMISTGAMIRLGKTYGNLMVDLKATNVKLRQRARDVMRIVAGPSCTETDKAIDSVLRNCYGNVKLACLVLRSGLEVPSAESLLRQEHGLLSRALATQPTLNNVGTAYPTDLVLCIDAGGTSCKAVIVSGADWVSRGVAGPCNISTIGVDAAIKTIEQAIADAMSNHPSLNGLLAESKLFAAAWIGIAGYDRPQVRPLIDSSLSQTLGLKVEEGLAVTADIDLLPEAVRSTSGIDSVIVLVAGTGSIAMRYQRMDDRFIRNGRAGGWGHLFGDEGSGYHLGREAARAALLASDIANSKTHHPNQTRRHEANKLIIDDRNEDRQIEVPFKFPPLASAVMRHIKQENPKYDPADILSGVLLPDATMPPPGNVSYISAASGRIAGFAHIVLSLADTDAEAMSIVEAGATSLCQLVEILAPADTLALSRTALILSGGLLKNDTYRNLVCSRLLDSVGSFGKIEVVQEPSLSAAYALRDRLHENMGELSYGN